MDGGGGNLREDCVTWYFVTYVASDIDALCYYCKVEEGCIFLM